MRLARLTTIAAAVVVAVSPLHAQAIHYEASQVTQGVYVFTPNDAGLANTAAVISQGEALVVDATATPAAAQQVLSALRGLGATSVRVLVNTHWHDDHVWGNQVFADSFPGLEIVAHPHTVDGMRDRAVPELSQQIARLHETIAARDHQLETGETTAGTPMSEEERTRLEGRQALFRDAVASLETVRPVLPAPLMSDEAEYRIGDLDVTVLHLGGGHTSGDLVVRVADRGVVMVGDVLTLPVPAAAEADVTVWHGTLDEIVGLDWTHLIPGHGAVQSDRDYARDMLALFGAVADHVRRGLAEGLTVDEMVEEADLGPIQDRWLGADSRQDAMYRVFFLEPAIRATHAGLTGGGPA